MTNTHICTYVRIVSALIFNLVDPGLPGCVSVCMCVFGIFELFCCRIFVIFYEMMMKLSYFSNFPTSCIYMCIYNYYRLLSTPRPLLFNTVQLQTREYQSR